MNLHAVEIKDGTIGKLRVEADAGVGRIAVEVEFLTVVARVRGGGCFGIDGGAGISGLEAVAILAWKVELPPAVAFCDWPSLVAASVQVETICPLRKPRSEARNRATR